MISKDLKDFVRRRSLEKIVFPVSASSFTQAPPTTTNLILDLSGFIKLSSFTLDRNPVNMLVAKYATQVNNEIKQALDSLGYLPQIKDAQNNVTQKGYTRENIWVNDRLGNLDWYEQIPLVEHLGYSRMDNRQGLDFINLLRNGLEGKIVKDGNDKQLEIDEIQDILDKLNKRGDPWRSEYLDARFEVTNDKVIIYSGHYTDSSLSLQERIKLENIKFKYSKEIPKNKIVMSDGWTKFDNFNEQGVCTKLEESDEVYNWYPRNDAVGRFLAYSDGFGLVCSGDPLDSGPRVGMRLAKILGV